MTSSLVNRIPIAIQLIVTSIAIVAFFTILGELVKWILSRLFPLEEQPGASSAAVAVPQNVAETLAVLEWVLSCLAMVLLPLAGYHAVARVLEESAPTGTIVVWFGGPAMVFGYVVAGACFGPWLVRQFIRRRYEPAASEKITDWYSRTEDHHGAAGRLFLTRSGSIAVTLVLLSTLYAGNRYTLVNARGFDVPAGIMGRRTIPISAVRRIVAVQSGGKHFRVELTTGEALTTSESIGSTGHLSGRGSSRAMEMIHTQTGLPLTNE